MYNLMTKPDKLKNKLPDKIMFGKEVYSRFYNQGYWKENNIPQELKDKNWIPVENNKYLIWYHWTNPSDPSDLGEDILDYIEDENFFIDFMKSHIYSKINYLSDMELLGLCKKLNIKYKYE